MRKGYNSLMASKQVKKKKKNNTLSKIIGICFVIAAIYIFGKGGRELITMIELQNEQKTVAEELKLLEEENQSLLDTKTKLEDPNYVTTYASGEYMFSKGDEKLFRLPSSKE